MASETVRRLRWNSLGCDSAAFHAALFAVEPGQSQAFRIAPHNHDFFEMLYVMTGTGQHMVTAGAEACRDTPLMSGDLLFLRPDDCHSIYVPSGGRLHWMNIAFPQPAWEGFRQAAGLTEGDWDSARMPPAANLIGRDEKSACRVAFEDALGAFQRWRITGDGSAPSRLHLCRFLSEVAPFLTETSAQHEDMTVPLEPPWLRRTCLAFASSPAYIAEGLPRLTALSGVTYTHLARSLKSATGRTPTQYVNDQRLARAALLLTTSPLTIIDIAGECGFAQLSYFYRQFQHRFGLPPHAYRQAARRSVAPHSTVSG
ncbi:MAG: AraC family transcriptional regulator [Armatimonadota bacterium]